MKSLSLKQELVIGALALAAWIILNYYAKKK